MFTQRYFLFHVEKAVGVSEFSLLQRRTDRMSLCREGSEPLGTSGGPTGRLCTHREMRLCLLHWRQPGSAPEGPVLLLRKTVTTCSQPYFCSSFFTIYIYKITGCESWGTFQSPRESPFLFFFVGGVITVSYFKWAVTSQLWV